MGTQRKDMTQQVHLSDDAGDTLKAFRGLGWYGAGFVEVPGTSQSIGGILEALGCSDTTIEHVRADIEFAHAEEVRRRE